MLAVLSDQQKVPGQVASRPDRVAGADVDRRRGHRSTRRDSCCGQRAAAGRSTLRRTERSHRPAAARRIPGLDFDASILVCNCEKRNAIQTWK